MRKTFSVLVLGLSFIFAGCETPAHKIMDEIRVQQMKNVKEIKELSTKSPIDMGRIQELCRLNLLLENVGKNMFGDKIDYHFDPIVMPEGF